MHWATGLLPCFYFHIRYFTVTMKLAFVKALMLLSMLLALASLTACEDEEGISLEDQAERDDRVIREYLQENGFANFIRTESGLYFVALEDGTGEAVPGNALVTVHYTGRLLYGKRFDSSVLRDEPFRFQVPTGRIYQGVDAEGNPVFSNDGVIAGWVEGVSLMERGQKGLLFIPSGLAYGSQGSGIIPGNAIIYFEMELLDFAQ